MNNGSCIANILRFLDKVTRGSDEGQRVKICHFDLNKAFDSALKSASSFFFDDVKRGRDYFSSDRRIVLGWVDKLVLHLCANSERRLSRRAKRLTVSQGQGLLNVDAVAIVNGPKYSF